MSDPRAQTSRAGSRLLIAVLLTALLLGAIPIWWGLPGSTVHTWAFDEISPNADGRTVESRHMGRYPPLHYHILRALYSPIRLAESNDLVELSPRELRTTLQLLGRALSLLLSLATVYLTYRTGRLLLSERASLLAALLVAVTLPFVFYAKTINLEAAYVFWFTLSLFFLARVLRDHRLRDYVLLGAAVACAIGTKDQAYGLYLALPFLLVGSLHRHRFERRPTLASLGQTLLDRRIVASAATALVGFALIHDLLFDFDGFLKHVRIMTGPGSEPSRVYTHTISGHLEMAGQAGRHLVFSLGWPAVIAALAGVFVAIRDRRRHRRLLALLLPLATYYAFFISVILYHRVRFFLPMCVVLALFAALALDRMWRNRRLPRPLAVLAVVIVVAVPMLRAISLDLAMFGDSRYFVETWLRENADSDDRVLVIGNHEQRLPRGFGSIPWRRLVAEGTDLLRKRDAQFLVYNPDEVTEAAELAILERLERGELNYQLRFRHRYEPWLDLVDLTGISSNLVTVNPGLTVLEKTRAWGLSAEEIGESLGRLAAEINQRLWVQVRNSILDAPVLEQRKRLSPEALSFGLHFDSWTRGASPAALVVTNQSEEPLRPSLRLTCFTPDEALPVLVTIRTRSRTLEVQFPRRGNQTVTLPPVAPGRSRMYLVSADTGWTAKSRRQLGIHLQLIVPSQDGADSES